MTLPPGTYTIHDTDSGKGLAYYSNRNRIGTWEYYSGSGLKWYVKRYPESSGYAIQSTYNGKYIPSTTDGYNMNAVDEIDAAVFNLEQQFQDIYLIQLIGTRVHLDHPNTIPKPNDDSYVPVGFANNPNTLKACFWRFEKVNDDSGSPLALRANASNSTSTPSVSQESCTSSRKSGSLYPDDAHLYTEMLFNMPRVPFTRDQRVAALDWARKLGATNVPTIESFEECERRLEAA